MQLATIFSRSSTAADTGSTPEGEDGVPSQPPDVSTSQRHSGKLPMLVRCKDREEECTCVVQMVADLLRKGQIAPEDIGIIYPRIERKNDEIFRRFCKSLDKVAPVVWISEKGGNSRGRIVEAGIKCQTILHAKGLQYRLVFLIWADLLPSHFDDTDSVSERSQLYVAITRAEEHLVITASGSSPFIEEIASSQFVDAKNFKLE